MAAAPTFRLRPVPLCALAATLLLPALDAYLPHQLQFAADIPTIMAYTIMGLGLNIIAGFTGLLNLGSAAFVAVGAYTFSILTCPIYPFQVGFWLGMAGATAMGGLAGALVALPTMRLRGDYVAIVTLGFGEIMQDVLKNLDAMTKGTQGLNPVALPALPGVSFLSSKPPSAYDYLPWYYLYLALLVGALWFCHNLRQSRLGRSWVAVREDELAARSMGLATPRIKLLAFALGSALCALGGALMSSKIGTSIDPNFYDFQQSVIILCIVIVGGMGSISGVVLGALIMVGFNSIVLTKLTMLYANQPLPSGHGFGRMLVHKVLGSLSDCKFMIYGAALILMMRLRPEGLLPAKDVQAELHHDDESPPRPAGASA